MWFRYITLSIFLCSTPIGWAAEGNQPGSGPSDYSIGVSDVLSIDIRNLGKTEYSFEVRVPRNGLVSVPMLDEVVFLGYSIQQLERLLEARLRDGYLKQPEVTISVAEYRPFYIDGAVENPGSYPFQHGLTVEKAIILAGGLDEFADVSNITVSTEGGSEEVRSVDPAASISAGDLITIGESYEAGGEKNVYLYGAVAGAGAIEYRPGLTVEKAIILAGGFSARASKRKITIRRGEGETAEEIKRAKLSAVLQPGDIITVGESFF